LEGAGGDVRQRRRSSDGSGTLSFISDSGNLIDTVLMSFSAAASSFFVAGSMKETMPLAKTNFHKTV
jgi:hypothetical protein